MLGAIIGDIVGSIYEFDRSPKIKNFGPLFTELNSYTDDSIMTLAVCEALLHVEEEASDEVYEEEIIRSMKKWGMRYPYVGYGSRFGRWLIEDTNEPYGSYGNGSAMRVSSVGWLYDTLEKTKHVAKLTAQVTHNHPEGIKGAQACACAIFLARSKASKEEIKQYIEQEFGYDLNRTCDEIRPTYHHVESCQETVPEAIIAFLEGHDFEDVIRNAISLGGDADTLTCIAGSIAEAMYGINDDIIDEVEDYLEDDMFPVLEAFYRKRKK